MKRLRGRKSRNWYSASHSSHLKRRALRGCGVTGSRASFKNLFFIECRFNSDHPYHFICECGVTGSRSRLRICREKSYGGSSPLTRTIFNSGVESNGLETHLETRYSSVVIARNTTYFLNNDDGKRKSPLKADVGSWVSDQPVKCFRL